MYQRKLGISWSYHPTLVREEWRWWYKQLRQISWQGWKDHSLGKGRTLQLQALTELTLQWRREWVAEEQIEEQHRPCCVVLDVLELRLEAYSYVHCVKKWWRQRRRCNSFDLGGECVLINDLAFDAFVRLSGDFDVVVNEDGAVCAAARRRWWRRRGVRILIVVSADILMVGKVVATLFFHEHMVIIVKVVLLDGTSWFNLVDVLPWQE